MNRELFILFMTLLLAGGVVACWIWSWSQSKFSIHDSLNAPVLSAVSVLFGLFVSFSATDVVQRSRQLQLFAQMEANNAQALFSLTESIGPVANPLKEALIEYAQAATTIEQSWLESGKQGQPPAQPQADVILQLATLYVSQAPGSDTVKALLTRKVDDLRQARVERINLSHATSRISLWIGLLVIAFVIQLVIALTHFGKRIASRVAVFAFTIAAASAMVYMGWVDGLVGPSRVVPSLEPMRQFLISANPD
jgi:hypothetical protein